MINKILKGLGLLGITVFGRPKDLKAIEELGEILKRRIAVKICKESLLRVNECCPTSRWKWFKQGQEPQKRCNLHIPQIYEICHSTGLRKNQYCPIWTEESFCPDKVPKICDYHKAKPPKPPKLIIKDNMLYFHNDGIEPFVGIGASSRKMLERELNLIGTEEEKRLWKEYGGTWKILEETYNYGLNYIRTNVVEDLDLVEAVVSWCYEHGIVIELTFDFQKQFPSPRIVFDRLQPYPCVLWEMGNEFSEKTTAEIIRNMLAWIDWLRSQGAIVSAGGFGAGQEGWADYFYKQNPNHQVAQVHRHWTPAWIKKYIDMGYIVGRNEYFDLGDEVDPGFGFNTFQNIMIESINAGAQLVNYYVFVDAFFGPTQGRSWFSDYAYWAGQYCKNLNSNPA